MQWITGTSPLASFTLWPIFLASLIVSCAETPPVSNVMPPRDATRIYVANESSNTVSVIDGDTFKPVGEIETLNHAIQKFPDVAELYYRQGILFMEKNMRKQSLELIERGLEMDYTKHSEVFEYAPVLQNDAELLSLISTYKK